MTDRTDQPHPEYAQRPPGLDTPGELASIGSRFLARLVDSLLIFVPLMAINIAMAVSQFQGLSPEERQARREQLQQSGGPGGGGLRFVIIVLVITALYEVGMVAWRGQTLGKILLKIRIVDEGGAIPSVGRAGVRWIVPQAVNVAGSLLRFGPLALLATMLVYLWAIWDPRNQGLHDKAAQTYVVKVAPAEDEAY